jgi:hypothetical protein
MGKPRESCGQTGILHALGWTGTGKQGKFGGGAQAAQATEFFL